MLPSHNVLPLAQESIPYIGSYFQAFIRISQHLQQRPFDRGFYHGLKHLLELCLGHTSNRIGSYLAILSSGQPVKCQASLVPSLQV